MPFDPKPAATALAHAWRSGEQISQLPENIRPQDLAQGYQVQDALIAAMDEGTAGWKLGLGSPAGMRASKIERPLVGRLLPNLIHRNGATVKLSNRAPVIVEFEIAYVLGQDIAPGEALADPMDAVEAMRVTFELVHSRFVDRRAAGLPSFVGDSVGFGALVVGNKITDRAGVRDTVRIEVDGKEVARALAGDDLTDPPRAFEYLRAHAKDHGITLRQGEICTLGALGKPFEVTGNVQIVARYLDAELRVTTQAP